MSGSVAARFQFISFKVDELTFKAQPTLGTLRIQTLPADASIDFQVGINTPQVHPAKHFYIGGVSSATKLYLGKEREEVTPIAEVSCSVSGLFQAEADIDPELERRMVTTNIPATLFPYMRAAITSMFANAGFGSIVLPLVNVVQLARESNLQIAYIDDPEAGPKD